MELNAESNSSVEGLQLRLEAFVNFSWTSLSPANSAPVSENWACNKPKTRKVIEMTVPILSGCLDLKEEVQPSSLKWHK